MLTAAQWNWSLTRPSKPIGSVMTNGGIFALESGIDLKVRRELQKIGHNTVHRVGPFGGYPAIM